MTESGEGLTKTRIHIGGLGGGVTEEDIRKTFSALGQVISVDVVRTKGRSFAYLDFLPSNDKSLPKLFSTYNGCMWKGGKLRLEKAKEHYLLRLKREWQEESEKASKVSDSCNIDAAKSHDTLEKPKKSSPADKTQINIFFPKLGKVKSLAQVGIGKHKYSFQRIEVPPTPTHFCDCEEHSLAFSPPVKKQSPETEKVNYEVGEQELNIMNSVMNKIFEKANPSKQVSRMSESTYGKDDLVVVNSEAADNLTDEDNLIINVANGKSDEEEMRSMMANRGPVSKKPTTSTEKPKIQKKTVSPPKKRKSPYSEENESGKTVIPETTSNSQTRVDTRKVEKTEVKSSAKQSDSNSLRSIKSTWKDMLGQKRKTSFNIADFIAQRKEEESKVDDTNDVLKEKNPAKKRKSEGDVNDELVSSLSETTSMKLLINKEPTSKEGTIITKNSTPETPAIEYEQKDGPKADSLEMPLPSKVSDVLPGAFNEKVEEPGNEYLDHNLEKLEKDQDIEKLNEASPVKCDQDMKSLNEASPVKCDQDMKSLNEASPVKCDQDMKSLNEPSPVKNEQDVNRTARGEFWRHKSSWTQLISTTSHTSFSISQFVPNLSFEKQEQQVDTSDPQPAQKDLDNQIPTGKKETSSHVKTNTSEKKRILPLRNLVSDGTSCSFMRTEDSMKEWKKAKASKNSSLNKKKRLANESS